MTVTNTAFAKFAVASVAVAMMFSVFASSAKAVDVSTMSLDELVALVAQLQAQLAGGTTASASCESIAAPLTIGSTGASVTMLQNRLMADGQTIAAGATGYFGAQTQAALAAWQAAHGVTPAVGYYGPITKAAMDAACVPATTGSTSGSTDTSSDLTGGAGSITDSQLLSDYSNEQVGEGEDDVAVLGLEIEPADSDLEIAAVKVDFDKGSNLNSNFDKYASEVSIWVDGDEYARVDASDFNRDNNYGRTITLDKGAIIREGDKGNIVVKVSGISNLDSNDEGDTWDVSIDSLRYRDATGATVSDTVTGMNTDRSFTFETFATASDLEVKLVAGDSSINTAQTIEVSSTTKTYGVEVFSFGVNVTGSPVMVDDIYVAATTTTQVINNVITTAYLYADGERVGSENITSTEQTDGYIHFSDLNLDLDEGTHDFVVEVDFNKADGSNYSNGETLGMDVTAANRADWYVEDENGDQIATTDMTGTVSGDDHTLRTQGLNLDLSSSTTGETYNSTTPASSYGTFTMEVELMAIGDTMYVPQTVSASSTASTTAGLTFYLQDSNGSAYTSGTTTQSFTRVSGGTVESSGRVRIDEGQSAIFKLVTTLDPAASGQYRAQIVSAAFNTSDAAANTAVLATPASDFQSGYQLISN